MNLINILKHIPQFAILYTTTHGYVEFLGIEEIDKSYPIILRIICNEELCIKLSEEGKILHDCADAECILFPSKTNRDWSIFKNGKNDSKWKPN